MKIGQKYLMDGNEVVYCREYVEAETAYFTDESGEAGFEVVFDGQVWRHQSSGDLLVIVEINETESNN